MRRRFTSTVLFNLSIILALGTVGCSSGPEGPERTEEAIESIQDTRAKLAAASKQVADTNAALMSLTSKQTTDLRPAFDSYVKSVRRTQSMAEEARERARTMQARSNEYVSKWQAEIEGISDEELRKRSQERMTSAKSDFNRIVTRAQEAREAYQPYMQGLQDVEKYLANDLTSGGVDSIRSKADRTAADGENLRGRLAALQTELDQLSSRWSAKVER